MKSLTQQQYTAYDKVYMYFNEHLFAGRLPSSLITFQRRRNTRGYFLRLDIAARHNQMLRTNEIALNPNTFVGRTDKDILSTLVHELCHLWQAHEGKPGRSRYHNRQWAREMLRIGLKPISLDQLGKMTEQRMTHELIPGGAFDGAADRLLASGFRLRWQSAVLPSIGDAVMLEVGKQKRNKVKFSYPVCEQDAWAHSLFA